MKTIFTGSKTIFTFSLILFSVLFLIGCTPKDNSSILPGIELVGDSVMEVEQYSDFVDPGATILGNFDLNVVVDSNVDTNTLGDYTITYTITYQDIDYVVTRTVRVVPEVTNPTPSLSINGDAITYVEQYSDFVDPGAELIGDLQLDITVESNVDTSTLGQYTITYSITYEDTVYSLSRDVIVVEPFPGIELNGESQMIIEQYSEFIDPGAYVNGDTSYLINTDSSVDPSTLGDYTITYSVDYYGTTYSTERSVSVVLSVPHIELNGDAYMTVEQYTGWIDPWVTITGDDQLQASVNNKVNTDVLGVYTLVYSIEYGGVTYNVSRDIEVVEPEVDSFDIQFTSGDITQNSISVSVVLTDDTGILNNTTVNIFKDYTLIESVPFTPGTNNITFSNLEQGTTYKIMLMGDYFADGTTMVLSGYEYEITTVAIEDLFDIQFTSGDITENSIPVTVVLTDDSGILNNTTVNIFKDYTLIESVPFTPGTNNITFSNLEQGTTYKIMLMGDYFADGTTMVLSGYEYELTTLSLGEISVDFGEYYEIGIDYMDFQILAVDENLVTTSFTASLYKGDELVQSYPLDIDYNWLRFEGLESEITYTLKIVYTYTPHSSSEDVSVTLYTSDYTTLKDVSPSLLSNVCTERYYNLDCQADIDSTGFENTYFWAELYQDGLRVSSTTLSNDFSYHFEYLDEDTNYTIKIYSEYTYSSTTDHYLNVLLGTYSVSTLTPGGAAPTIENASISNTDTTITFNFDLVDSENSFDSGYLRLYKGYYLVSSEKIMEGNNEFTFNGLDQDTTYTLKVDVDYEGNGSYPTLYEEDVYILPVITVDEFVEDHMIFQNEPMRMRLALGNNSDVHIVGVTINGEQKDLLFPSDNETVYFNIGTFDVTGTYVAELQNVIIEVNGTNYTVPVEAWRDVVIHAPGSIAPDDANVRVIDIIPEDYYVTVDRSHPDEVTYLPVSIYLDNEYNLDVTAVSIGGVTYYDQDLTVISPTELLVNVPFSYNGGSNNNLSLSAISFYRNGDLITGEDDNHTTVSIYKIFDSDNNSSTSEVIHVSTPSEFLDIFGDPAHPSVTYILDNDIDMSGIDYTPIGTYAESFTGSLNGDGYTVSNLTINQIFTAEDDTQYVGLFGYSHAFISNLNLDNITINVTATPDNYLYLGILSGYQAGNVYNVHVTNSTININELIKGDIGGLVGFSSGDIINSSTDTTITITNTTDASTSYRLYVGGLVGEKMYDDIRNSHTSGDITITQTTSHTVFTGGLAGYMYNNASSEPNYIKNSYSTSNISVETNYYGRTGGLVGDTYMYSNSTVVINSYASGDVFATGGKTGGLAGETYVRYISSFATGTISCSGGTVSRLFGIGNDYNLENIYAYDGQAVYRNTDLINGNDFYFNNIGLASSEQFNDVHYYTDFLDWNEHFFNFNTLDIEQNILPTATDLSNSN
jgi:hypothetical protein